MPGLLDGSDDWLKLLKAQLEPSAGDKKQAFNTALMTAGAAMMAGNNGRQPASAAIGQGLLGGIQGYQQNISDQRKDAMGHLQGLQGIVGLGHQLQNEKYQQQYYDAMSGRQPQMVPQSDFAPGEAPGPTTPPMQPMPTGNSTRGGPMGGGTGPSKPPLELLQGFAISPNKDIASRALEQIKVFYPQFELSMGQQRYGNDGKLMAQNTDPTKPVMQGDGSFANAPGAVDAIAEQEKRKAEASEGAKVVPSLAIKAGEAALDVVRIPDGRNGFITIPRAEALKKLGLPTDLPTAYQNYLKGDTSQPFQFTPSPQQPIIGQERSPEAIAAATAAATAEAKAPIEVAQKYNEGLQLQNLKLREQVIDQAKSARQQREMTNRFMQLNSDPNVASGRFAESISGLKNAAASFGVDIKGLAGEQAMQSIGAQMALAIRNPDSGMGMPGAVSRQDLSFLQSMPPGLNQSKDGRALIADTYNAINDRALHVQRMMLEHEKDGGKFDSGFLKKVSDYGDNNPIFTKSRQEQLDKLAAPPQAQTPTPGSVVDGYVYRGGDPKDPKNWMKAR